MRDTIGSLTMDTREERVRHHSLQHWHEGSCGEPAQDLSKGSNDCSFFAIHLCALFLLSTPAIKDEGTNLYYPMLRMRSDALGLCLQVQFPMSIPTVSMVQYISAARWVFIAFTNPASNSKLYTPTRLAGKRLHLRKENELQTFQKRCLLHRMVLDWASYKARMLELNFCSVILNYRRVQDRHEKPGCWSKSI